MSPAAEKSPIKVGAEIAGAGAETAGGGGGGGKGPARRPLKRMFSPPSVEGRLSEAAPGCGSVCCSCKGA